LSTVAESVEQVTVFFGFVVDLDLERKKKTNLERLKN